MEEIIGLLIALAAVIFKAVGNRLEKSGKTPSAPVTSEEDPETGGLDVKGWILEALEEAKGEVLGEEEAAEPEPFIEPVEGATHPVIRPAAATPAAKPKKPMLQEETPEKKGEKIDPKKLVIYSEIMKPKF